MQRRTRICQATADSIPRKSPLPLLLMDAVATHFESRTNWKRFRGSVTFPLMAWLKSTPRQIRKRTHSNGCKLPTTIKLFGWDTSRSTLFLTGIAPMSALRIFSGAWDCPDEEGTWRLALALRLKLNRFRNILSSAQRSGENSV